MPFQASHPVIQIINGDKKDIGLGRTPSGGGKSHTKNGGEKFHGGGPSSRSSNALARKSNKSIAIHLLKRVKNHH
jgi:hypothetical protein